MTISAACVGGSSRAADPRTGSQAVGTAQLSAKDMDSTVFPWIVAIAACASAVAAAVSAVGSWRSSRAAASAATTAASAATTAANVAATNLILKFRDQYASHEMLIDLHNLGAWYDKYDSSTFAKIWQEERQQGDKEALIVNASRRRVSHFFSSIADLYNANLVPEHLKKLLIDFDGFDVFYSVVEPLERELNPGYNRTPFDTLRKLRPPRVGLIQYAPIDWVIREP
jgi:hypothetical protein